MARINWTAICKKIKYMYKYANRGPDAKTHNIFKFFWSDDKYFLHLPRDL